MMSNVDSRNHRGQAYRAPKSIFQSVKHKAADPATTTWGQPPSHQASAASAASAAPNLQVPPWLWQGDANEVHEDTAETADPFADALSLFLVDEAATAKAAAEAAAETAASLAAVAADAAAAAAAGDATANPDDGQLALIVVEDEATSTDLVVPAKPSKRSRATISAAVMKARRQRAEVVERMSRAEVMPSTSAAAQAYSRAVMLARIPDSSVTYGETPPADRACIGVMHDPSKIFTGGVSAYPFLPPADEYVAYEMFPESAVLKKAARSRVGLVQQRGQCSRSAAQGPPCVASVVGSTFVVFMGVGPPPPLRGEAMVPYMFHRPSFVKAVVALEAATAIIDDGFLSEQFRLCLPVITMRSVQSGAAVEVDTGGDVDTVNMGGHGSYRLDVTAHHVDSVVQAIFGVGADAAGTKQSFREFCTHIGDAIMWIRMACRHDSLRGAGNVGAKEVVRDLFFVASSPFANTERHTENQMILNKLGRDCATDPNLLVAVTPTCAHVSYFHCSLSHSLALSLACPSAHPSARSRMYFTTPPTGGFHGGAREELHGRLPEDIDHVARAKDHGHDLHEGAGRGRAAA
jgi:hypothetical protein